MVRKIFKGISFTIAVIVIVGIILTGLFRNPNVQTYLARAAAIHLSEYLDTQIKIEKLRISAFLNLTASGIEIHDLNNKQMLTLKQIDLTTDLFEIIESKLAFKSVEIDGAQVFLNQYKEHADLNVEEFINRFLSSNYTPEDSLKGASKTFLLDVNNLEIANSRFVLQIEEDLSEPAFGLNYSDLDVFDIQAKLSQISIYSDSISAVIEQLAAKEKSGFQLKNFGGDFNISDHGLVLENGLLKTNQSSINLKLNLSYPSWEAFSNYIDEVNMSGEIISGVLNLNDIAYFVPQLEGMDNPIKIECSFNGPVRNLRVRNLLLSLGNDTKFDGNVQLTGLPEVLETFVSLRIREFSTSVADIETFRLPLGKVLDSLPGSIAAFGSIRVKGNFTGFYNDFVSNAKFSTNIGELNTDIQFSNNPEREIIEYRGDFKGRQFGLGRFLDRNDLFGDFDFNLRVKGEGLSMEELYANVEGEINAFQFKNEQLDAVAINGLFQERQFTGAITINDELGKADFEGHINFDTLVPVFDFNLNLERTRLALLGILPIDSSATLSSNIRLNFSGNTLDNIRGEIRLDSTLLLYKNAAYDMQSFKLSTFSASNSKRTIRLYSDFIDGEIDGEFHLGELKSTTNLFLNNYLPNLIAKNDFDENIDTKNIVWDIRIKDISPILNLLEQPIQVSENSHWEGRFDVDNNELNSEANLLDVVYGGVKLDNVKINISNRTIKEGLNAELAIDAVIFKEEKANDTLQLSIDNFRFSTLAMQDSLNFHINWKNKFKAIKNKADIAGFVSLSDISNVDVKLQNADLIINDTTWNIHPENMFRVEKHRMLFTKVGFYSGSQQVEISGAVDEGNDQALKISFNHFDISNFDILLNYKNIDLDGLIYGKMQFINILKNVDFITDLRIEGFNINKELIGDVRLNSKRNMDKSIFLNAEIVNRFMEKGSNKPMVFEGIYYPDKVDNSLDFSLYLNQLPVQVASPFLYQWVDDFSGTASGNVLLKGSLEKPDLKGDIRLESVGFRIIYLNTKYKLTANTFVDNYFIDLRDASLLDEFNNEALVYGGLYHKNLKEFGVDLSVWPDHFMGLNTRRGMNSLFYGKAFVTGSVDISGLLEDVILDINLEANKGSEMVIPINLTADISDNEFITFVNNADTLLEKFEVRTVAEPSSFSLNMDLSLSPDARVEIILPEDLGNIRAQGYGDLNMNLNTAGNFTMAGDYRVSKGSFLFTVKNVYKKRFDLVEGGTISWTGDPYAGEMDMKAIYHVKTSLSTLGTIQDTTSNFRSRVPVDCVIGLKDQILNPTVKFGFNFPNSPEQVRQSVFSLIDTTNEAEMSQQMLSLLVLNSFSFASLDGNEDFASSVGGSSLQFVANQLGSWLSQISSEVDVGIKYRPGGVLTNKELEVALSTQFFDDRITVETNFGTQDLDSKSRANTSNIVGDINVEYKITKDGRFRLKGFNRTNTVDLIDNTAPFTQGVGVFYRKEFNFFKDLFKWKKNSKTTNKSGNQGKQNLQNTSLR